MKGRSTILIGGERRDARDYMEKINLRVGRLESALGIKKRQGGKNQAEKFEFADETQAERDCGK